MAKYYNSNWGTIIGKLGDAVGSVYRGIRVVRILFFSDQEIGYSPSNAANL